jgi:hypothetical protein
MRPMQGRAPGRYGDFAVTGFRRLHLIAGQGTPAVLT